MPRAYAVKHCYPDMSILFFLIYSQHELVPMHMGMGSYTVYMEQLYSGSPTDRIPSGKGSYQYVNGT